MSLRVGDWHLHDYWGLPEVKAATKTHFIGLRHIPALALVATLALAAGILELRSSWVEAWVFFTIARHATFSVAEGPSRTLERPGHGPYDQRLGFAELPDFLRHLETSGYRIEAQARNSSVGGVLGRLSLFPVYHESDQAGLRILDRNGRELYRTLFPRQVYPNFQSIPPLIVDTLLFIENREMLDTSHPHRNPAIQWGRLSRAMLDLAIHKVDHKHELIGGSTLATQLEKMRHSPGGRTDSVVEKTRQMLSASLSAYQGGPNTLQAQRAIVCHYINSIPLSATTKNGDVIGLADGLRDWFGEDFDTVNRWLSAAPTAMDPGQKAARARAYREVLTLLLALRAPSRDLRSQRRALALQTDRYLHALCRNGIISADLRDRALTTKLRLAPSVSLDPNENFVANKGRNAIRMKLLSALGLNNTYALDRLDLDAQTTLDKASERSVTDFLKSLSNPDAAKAAGLDQYQLLNVGDPKSVIFSVTLYERGRGENLLRIQTDNYDQPLNINQGTKLQLGSTAKLRTLINYLQIIEELHHTYAAMPPAELKAAPVNPGDKLTQWAIGYLATATDRALEPMLEAALQRKYSGNPGEAFFTAGGLHHFDNFEKSEDSQIMTVSYGFQHSVNLVFIRLMRDIERYYMFRVPGATPSVLSDPNDPARDRYLARFADFEGCTFLRRFYKKYGGQTPDQSLATLVAGVHLTPLRATVIFRSIRPDADLDQVSAFLHAHLPASALAAVDLQELYTKYGPDKFNWNDRGYLAHVHPLELWLLDYREHHPDATLAEIIVKSAPERQYVYQWLFKTRHKHARDKRIETLLEIDAFRKIHRAWQRLGYPFDSLVPSYATSIGVSGDTPRALAELVGIVLNNGVREPTVALQQLQFAKGTPFEVTLKPQTTDGVQVLSPEIVKLVREQMIGVVQNGTGRRVQGGVKLPDSTVLALGGKTGTGDNRFHEYGAHGWLLGEHVVNRTAAFVFFIGDRFYGTILAFVPGNDAAHYKFTSALAVQVLRDLEPRLMPLLYSSGETTPERGGAAKPVLQHTKYSPHFPAITARAVSLVLQPSASIQMATKGRRTNIGAKPSSGTNSCAIVAAA